MSNFLTNDTKAIILLCGVFGNASSVKPLSQTEYNALVHWLINSKRRPEDLLEKGNIVAASIDSGIDCQRLETLLGRGVQLGFAVEEWQRNGIWIISRSDIDYPIRYKRHLKDKAPPLLFGIGDRSLLSGGGVAIIGSRNVDKDGESFTRQTAELCALSRMPVVSGGARGVDQFAMSGALDAGGVTIGIIAENLLKKSLERNARKAIAEGRLLLISPYHPNARFTVGTAMSRNKLIYAMADYGLVVCAEHKKGGTWSGATEELRKEHPVTIFVRMGNNVTLANNKLLELGAVAWPEQVSQKTLKNQLRELSIKTLKKSKQMSLDLFAFKGTTKKSTEKIKQVAKSKLVLPKKDSDDATLKQSNPLYKAVLPVILNCLETTVTLDELSEALDVSKTQLRTWLKKAVDENKVIKLSRPVRYQKAESLEQVQYENKRRADGST